MSRVPTLGDTYKVSPGITAMTISHLQAYPRTEAICFWLGSIEGNDATLISEVWIPQFTATAVSYDIDPLEMLRLKEHLDASGLALYAQVHSHPGTAFHSSRDDLNAASPWPGFISIVMPDGGRIQHDFLSAAEVYELLGGGKWKHLTGIEKQKRFRSS